MTIPENFRSKKLFVTVGIILLDALMALAGKWLGFDPTPFYVATTPIATIYLGGQSSVDFKAQTVKVTGTAEGQ